MPERIRPITEADVRRLASEQSFERGASYYRGGAIFEPVHQGDELRARCTGSGYEPYRVSATVGSRGIEATRCTCPYDWGGICKHIVALLLTWIHEPESFQEYVRLDETLAGRSKEELIVLVKEIFRREPDLMRLLELPLQSDPQTPLDLDAFRRQIQHAYEQGYEFPDAEVVALELRFITQTAARFCENEDWANAGALYHLILDEVVPDYENLYDEDGDVAYVLHDCAQGLDACLNEGEPDAETRRAWLEVLLEAEIKDVEIGGIDLAYPAGEVVIRHATDEEWDWGEARVRQAIEARTDRYSRWGREALVGFLTRRMEATGRDEGIDDLIFELGSPQQRAFRLAQLGRVDAAVEIARKHFVDLPGLIFEFADALVEAGAGPAAEAYVSDLLNTRSRLSCLSWLAHYAEQQGDSALALEYWRQHFRESPRLETYQHLQSVAEPLGQWDSVRLEVLAQLETHEQWHLLLEVALDEGDVARALDLLPHLKGWYVGDYEIKVAQAAEAAYPQAALDIYCRHVQRLIDARGRGNYQMAAELLRRVRDLYRRRGASAEWEQYIIDLRELHRRLPALQDELNQAGL